MKNNAPFPHHGPITNWPNELKVISRILDDNPQTLELIVQDLSDRVDSGLGAPGLTAEQVLRCAVVKQAEFSQEELEDIYLMRRNLEGLAAELAMDRLTDGDLQRLRALFGRMERATQQEKHRELMRLNREFHFTIYNACGRRHLLGILADLWNRSSRYRNLQELLPQRVQESLEEHREILEGCEKRSKRRGAKTIRYNIEECRKALTKSK